MSSLPDGEYLLTNVQWHNADADQTFRPLHGFTTGRLTVDGTAVCLGARFNDQFLSNQLKSFEEDNVPLLLQVAVIEEDGVYRLRSTPVIDRSGASYKLRASGDLRDVPIDPDE